MKMNRDSFFFLKKIFHLYTLGSMKGFSGGAYD